MISILLGIDILYKKRLRQKIGIGGIQTTRDEAVESQTLQLNDSLHGTPRSQAENVTTSAPFCHDLSLGADCFSLTNEQQLTGKSYRKPDLETSFLIGASGENFAGTVMERVWERMEGIEKEN